MSESGSLYYIVSARTFYLTIGSMSPKRRASASYGTRCVGLLCRRSMYHMLNQSALTGKVLDGQRDCRACHRGSRWRDRKRRWLTMIAGQCEFEHAVGDTPAFAWVVHPFAIPPLSAKCLHSPRSCASELAVPSSRFAQVLMPHERRASVPSELTLKYTLSISPTTWGVVPLLHRLGCDTYGRDKWAILPDSYLSACAYSTQCRGATTIAQCRACKTRPACSAASYDLPVHIVTTHTCCCHGAGIRGAGF
jgi:hypothetical protein